MSGRPSVWRGPGARVIAAGVILALAPLPVAAAETLQPAPASVDLRAAVRRIAATERLSTTPAAPALQPTQQGSEPKLESKAFFKTPLGVVVIAIVGGGTAYALYSAQHDRIHSTVR